MNKVWVVMDADYDHSWIVAVYPNQGLADEHVALMGGHIHEADVLTSLHPDAIDPVKQRERAEEFQAARRQHEWHEQFRSQRAESADRARPHDKMLLCHCETFSDGSFRTKHGYCQYCGGWAPAVFRAHKGEEALQLQIDKLAEHDRNKMRKIVGADFLPSTGLIKPTIGSTT